jgi:two-component system, OmpR family, phosphate regulon sensor histidine kinase PhoR
MWSHLGRSRLFWKFSASYLAIVLFTAMIIGALVAWRIEQAALQEGVDVLRAKGMLLRELVIPALDHAQDPALQTRVRALGQEIGTRLTVLSVDGTVLADSDDDPSTMANHANRPEVVEAGRRGIGTARRYSGTLRTTMLYLALPVRAGDRLLGYVRASRALSQIDAELHALYLIILFATGIATVAGLLLGLWIAKRLTMTLLTSITTISTTAAQLAATTEVAQAGCGCAVSPWMPPTIFAPRPSRRA